MTKKETFTPTYCQNCRGGFGHGAFWVTQNRERHGKWREFTFVFCKYKCLVPGLKKLELNTKNV